MAGAHGRDTRQRRLTRTRGCGPAVSARSVRRGRIPPKLLGGIFPAVSARHAGPVGLGAFVAVAENDGGGLEVASSRAAEFRGGRPAAASASTTLEQIARQLCCRDIEALAPVLDAFGSLHRLRILACLLEGPTAYRMLQKRTALTAGPLYHHVNQLRLAGLVAPKARDTYLLTRAGRNALLVMLALLPLLKDRSPRGTDGRTGVDHPTR